MFFVIDDQELNWIATVDGRKPVILPSFRCLPPDIEYVVFDIPRDGVPQARLDRFEHPRDAVYVVGSDVEGLDLAQLESAGLPMAYVTIPVVGGPTLEPYSWDCYLIARWDRWIKQDSRRR